MIPTILIAGIVLVLFISAVRYTHKHGQCEICGDSGCSGHCNLASKIPFDQIRKELDEEKRLNSNG